MTWYDTVTQAAALRELADGLADKHDYAADLLADVLPAAYKAAPQLREASEMDPSRIVDHRVINTLSSPEFAELCGNRRAGTSGRQQDIDKTSLWPGEHVRADWPDSAPPPT